MTRRILLISSSRIHGSTYMGYCAKEVQDFFGAQRHVLFIPYAAKDYDQYASKVAPPLGELGLTVSAIHTHADPKRAIAETEALFIGGGNTFLLLKTLYDLDLLDLIRDRVFAGMPYMGSSAGSNVACLTMKTTNDMPIVYPPSFDALNLVPFNLNPHYQDPDPVSTHMGETREDRIREFHEHNEVPVVGLREGGLLHVEGDHMWLKGVIGCRLFRPGHAPEEFSPVADLSFLLHP
jgi:dipeptidase E